METIKLAPVNWDTRFNSRVDADIWGFQELWHYQALERVFEKAELRDNYRLLAPKDHQGEGIICAGRMTTIRELKGHIDLKALS